MVTSHMMEEGGVLSLAAVHTLGLTPSSYKRRPLPSPSHTPPCEGLSSPSSFSPWIRTSEVHVLHSFFGRICCFRCSAGAREWELVTSRMCARVRKRCWFAALFFSILRSVSVRLHHPRSSAGTFPDFGLRGYVFWM